MSIEKQMNSNNEKSSVAASATQSHITSTQMETTAGGLFLSAIFAGLTALAILVLFWFPAEYGVDFTGAGRVMGLTQMGELKEQQHHNANAEATGLVHVLPGQSDTVEMQWRDQYEYPLDPGEGIEVKLLMASGDKAHYRWTANGAVVYHDTHGEGAGKSISYEKGHGVPQDQGTLTAAFDGQHGWWWRNTTDDVVTVNVWAAGVYEQMLTP